MSGRSIVIAAPIRPTARSGNDVTAGRWADHLERLGHHVTVVAADEQADRPDEETAALLDAADMLIAIHARRSAPVIAWWADRHPDRPVVVALSGTDLYGDLPTSDGAVASVERASALIVLQRAAAERVAGLRAEWGDKTTVIHQSVAPPLPPRRPADDELRVVVLAHLRSVKDPLLTARAARHLDPASRVTVHHAGQAFDRRWEEEAIEEQAANPRYHWHRELDRDAALELLATGRALACTSLTEGGANVVTEAIGPRRARHRHPDRRQHRVAGS